MKLPHLPRRCIYVIETTALGYARVSVLGAALFCLPLWLKAANIPRNLPELRIVVSLESVTNLTGLIAAEDNWVSTNSPGYELVDFVSDFKVISGEQRGQRRNRDVATITFEGMSRKVIFTYDPIPQPTSIHLLWTGYMPYLVGPDARKLALAQLGRFATWLLRMDI